MSDPEPEPYSWLPDEIQQLINERLNNEQEKHDG